MRFAIVMAVLAGMPAWAAAEEPKLIDYKVSKGETCFSISKKLYGDPKWVELIHANNTMGPPPHSLKAGQVLRLPPTIPSGPAEAKLTFLRNVVEAYTPEKHPGQKNEDLMRGHRVSTLAASSAEVTFVDTSRLQLGEHTLVVILGETSKKAKATSADTTLLNGSLRAHLSELAGKKPVSLGTPGASVAFGAGEAQLSVDDKHATRLAVYRGKSQLKARRRVVAVAEGFGSKVEEGKAPTKPRPLPTAPLWTAPPPGAVLTTESGKANLIGEFGGPPAGAVVLPAYYHLQLARDERFNDLLVDERVDKSVRRLEARQVPDGNYYARVSAIDGDQFEGKPSRVVMTRVATIKLTPPHGGRAGQVETPHGLACGLDHQPMRPHASPIVLDPHADHTLRCTGDAAATPGALDITPENAALKINVETSAETTPGAAGLLHGEVRFTIREDTGLPVPNAQIILAPTPDVALDRVSAEAQPGYYVARVTYRASTKPITLRFLVNALERVDAVLPPASAKPGPRAVRAEVAVFGAGHYTEPSGGSVGGGAEIGPRFALGSLALAMAARGQADGHVGRPGNYMTYTLGLPLNLRMRPVTSSWVPYAGIMPAATFRSVDGGAVKTIFSFAVHLGFQVLAGPGSIFIEGGYERPFGTDPGADLIYSITGVLGYRFGL